MFLVEPSRTGFGHMVQRSSSLTCAQASRIPQERRGKAHAHYECRPQDHGVHESVAERQHTREATRGRAGRDARGGELRDGNEERGNEHVREACGEPHKDRAPHEHYRDMDQQSDADRRGRTERRRARLDERANRREQQANAAESMADRDQRAGRRAGGDTTDGNRRRSHLRAHAPKQAVIDE